MYIYIYILFFFFLGGGVLGCPSSNVTVHYSWDEAPAKMKDVTFEAWAGSEISSW